MLRNFRALKMTVSLESVMHNNGQRDSALGDLPAGRGDRLAEGGWRAVGRQRRLEDDQVVEVQAAA